MAAACGGRPGCDGQTPARGGRRAGPARRVACDRGGRRQRRGGGWYGRGARGCGQQQHRHERRPLRPLRQHRARSAGPPAHLLPCRPSKVSHDGGDALGGRRVPLAPRRFGIPARTMRNADLRFPYDQLTAMAAAVPPGAEGLLFLPYLTGERTPHLDPLARGAFVGLTARHTTAHLIRAVMEAVLYSLRDGLEIMRGLNVPIVQIRATGGGGRSPLWRQMQADLYNAEGVTVSAEEGPAYGAALLAGVGTGLFASVAG